MELLYVWIDKYKNIKEQGFCFSGEYDIVYTPKDNTLKIDKREDYVEGFWGERTVKDKEGKEKNVGITNLTAIVGENGAGKSTLLDFLMKRTNKEKQEVSALFVWKEDTEKYITIKAAHTKSKSITPDPQNHKDIEYKLSTFDDFLTHFLWVHYSIFFDPFQKSSHTAPKNQEYLSTNSLICHDYGNLPSQFLYGNVLSTHRIKERQREVSSVYFFEDKNILTFDMPQYLQVSIISVDEYPQVDKKTPYRQQLDDTERFVKPTNKEEQMFQSFWEAALDSFLYNNHQRADYKKEAGSLYKDEEPYQIIEDILKKTLLDDKKGKGIQDIKSFFELISKQENVNVSFRVGQAKSLLKVEEYLKKADISGEKIKGIPSTRKFVFDRKKHRFLKDFMSAYNNSIGWFMGYLSFNWAHTTDPSFFSSGEQTLLTLISRIEGVFKNQKLRKLQHCVLLIDEGELTLHPEWQRKFVDILVSLLNTLAKDKGKTVQVILATHSPLILSDIPKNNVIFLKKWNKKRDEEEHGNQNIEEGNCYVVPQEDTPQTFGANIHTLLADSFFLQGSLMGEYAKNKINEIIGQLNKSHKPDEEKPDLEGLEKHIEMVGEPLLKMQLEKKLTRFKEQQTEDTPDQIKRQIEKLQKKLNKMEGGQDD